MKEENISECIYHIISLQPDFMSLSLMNNTPYYQYIIASGAVEVGSRPRSPPSPPHLSGSISISTFLTSRLLLSRPPTSASTFIIHRPSLVGSFSSFHEGRGAVFSPHKGSLVRIIHCPMQNVRPVLSPSEWHSLKIGYLSQVQYNPPLLR